MKMYQSQGPSSFTFATLSTLKCSTFTCNGVFLHGCTTDLISEYYSYRGHKYMHSLQIFVELFAMLMALDKAEQLRSTKTLTYHI